jgi:hypothetical protein
MTLHWNGWMYECMFEWYFTIACKAALIILYVVYHLCVYYMSCVYERWE